MKELANLFGFNPYYLKNFKKKKIIRQTISNELVPIGFEILDIFGGDIYGRWVFLDFSGENNPRIGVIGMTGTGKTTLVSGLLFNAFVRNFKILIPFDIKGEYKEKLIKVAKGNGVFNFKQFIQVFSPPFLDNGKPFYLDINDLDVDDIINLLGLEPDDLKYQMLKRIQKEVLKYKKLKLKYKHLKVLFERPKKLKEGFLRDYEERSIVKLAGSILFHPNFEFFKEGNNILTLLTNNKINIFDFSGFDVHEELGRSYIAVFVKYLRNCLAELYKKGERLKLITVFEEAHRLSDTRRIYPSHREILTSVRQTRMYGESMVFIVQGERHINSKILEQCQLLLFPASHQLLLKMLDQVPMIEEATIDEFLRKDMKIARLIKSKFGVNLWVLIDKLNGTLKTFIPSGYLSLREGEIFLRRMVEI